MKAYTYIERGKFVLTEKPKLILQNDTDAGICEGKYKN